MMNANRKKREGASACQTTSTCSGFMKRYDRSLCASTSVHDYLFGAKSSARCEINGLFTEIEANVCVNIMPSNGRVIHLSRLRARVLTSLFIEPSMNERTCPKLYLSLDERRRKVGSETKSDVLYYCCTYAQTHTHRNDLDARAYTCNYTHRDVCTQNERND